MNWKKMLVFGIVGLFSLGLTACSTSPSTTSSAKSGGMPSIVKKYGLKSDNQVLTWTRKIKRYDSLRI